MPVSILASLPSPQPLGCSIERYGKQEYGGSYQEERAEYQQDECSESLELGCCTEGNCCGPRYDTAAPSFSSGFVRHDPMM